MYAAFFAIITIAPEENIAIIYKIFIIVLLTMFTLLIWCLYLQWKEIPEKLKEIEIREIKLENAEKYYSEDIRDFLPQKIRYTNYVKDLELYKDGTSRTILIMQIKNISGQRLCCFNLPYKRVDLYEEKITPPYKTSIKKVEEIENVYIDGKPIEKARFDGMIKTITIIDTYISDRLDEAIRSPHHVAINYSIILLGNEQLDPDESAEIKFITKNRTSFKNILTHESSSILIHEMRDKITTRLISKDPELDIELVGGEGIPHGIDIIDNATKFRDPSELANINPPHRSEDGKTVYWTIKKPKIGFAYGLHFHLKNR